MARVLEAAGEVGLFDSVLVRVAVDVAGYGHG